MNISMKKTGLAALGQPTGDDRTGLCSDAGFRQKLTFSTPSASDHGALVMWMAAGLPC